MSEVVATEAPEETSLYRIYGAADLLLYIGITNDFGRRWKQHARKQPWWGERRRLTVDEWFDFRSEAEAAEEVAIKAERPKYNKRYLVDPAPRRLHLREVATVPAGLPRPLATAGEAAAYLQVPETRLAYWRRGRDVGPEWYRVGRSPLYPWGGVEKWQAEQQEIKRQVPARPQSRASRRSGATLSELRTCLLDAYEDAIVLRGAA